LRLRPPEPGRLHTPRAQGERRIVRRGAAHDHNNKQLRRHEREIAEQAERVYTLLAAQWQPTRLIGRHLPAIPGTDR